MVQRINIRWFNQPNWKYQQKTWRCCQQLPVEQQAYPDAIEFFFFFFGGCKDFTRHPKSWLFGLGLGWYRRNNTTLCVLRVCLAWARSWNGIYNDIMFPAWVPQCFNSLLSKHCRGSLSVWAPTDFLPHPLWIWVTWFSRINLPILVTIHRNISKNWLKGKLFDRVCPAYQAKTMVSYGFQIPATCSLETMQCMS